MDQQLDDFLPIPAGAHGGRIELDTAEGHGSTSRPVVPTSR
ncbi:MULTISPECIES: cell wall metabolism sensor histidine kinase WalK [unclassified Actinopolyspora]|nr:MULTISPECIES: cell wall metabolism sensor histidine kinase WalK [unclassified Actinopolyspora]NHD18171.1 cell wall metabolism sensor histidine kinase WalK [Actinopolyspora sp. BKK2]NHE77152.1 cell wall metabolism sensor histidine kinase WalK [Actinopolyspora sp. BKK1]